MPIEFLPNIEQGFLLVFGIICFLIGLAAGLMKKHKVKAKGIRVGDLLVFLFGAVIGYIVSPYATEAIIVTNKFMRDVSSIPSIIIAFTLIVLLAINIAIYHKVNKLS